MPAGRTPCCNNGTGKALAQPVTLAPPLLRRAAWSPRTDRPRGAAPVPLPIPAGMLGTSRPTMQPGGAMTDSAAARPASQVTVAVVSCTRLQPRDGKRHCAGRRSRGHARRIAFADGRITFVAPAGFTPLTGDEMRVKFPSATAPRAAVGNERRTTTIAYDLLDQRVPSTDFSRWRGRPWPTCTTSRCAASSGSRATSVELPAATGLYLEFSSGGRRPGNSQHRDAGGVR